MIVSFTDYEVTPRFDGTAWTRIQIGEAATEAGPFTTIDTINIVPLDPDPAHPEPRSFTTEHATLAAGWYLVTFLDALNNQLVTDPIYNTPAEQLEIMASLNDINANLDGEVVEATASNTDLIQISVARVIRGYLAQIVDPVIMATWVSPEATPEIIREVAGKMIAAQLYYNETAKSSTTVAPTHYAQVLYNQAMELLNQIVQGEVVIGGIPTTPLESVELGLDYFPIDDTDRAFSMGLKL
jgi:hypothetical protein